MGGISRMRDGGAFCKAVALTQNNALTAGGSGDATEVDSGWINVAGYQSCKLVIQAKSSIASAKALNMTAALKDATDGSGTGSATFGTGVTAKQMDGPGTNTLSAMELDYDLRGARGYIQANLTPDLTATSTDTSNFSAVLILFGAQEDPETARAN